MKPTAKKGLMVIGLLYIITVGAMVYNFVQRAEPEYPAAVTERIHTRLNEIREEARLLDEEHIRSSEITEKEAAAVFQDLFVQKGTIININYTIIMQGLNFGILLLILYGWLWDPLLAFLDKRRQMVKDRLEEADDRRKEAEKLREQRRQELADLRAQRSEIIEKARSTAEQQREQIIEQAEDEAERVSRQTRERLEEEFRRARQTLRDEVADLTTRVAGRLMKREMSSEDHREFIEEMVQKMELEGRGPETGGET
ncbi:MAG: F0F1 ATP synthase subunit B [Candidatus Brocadiia bacterium]